MVLIVILAFSNTTTNAMTTTTNNTLSVYIANTCVVNSASFFGGFQQTTVGSNDVTIHTIVPPAISAEPYRKVMAIILFFCRILALSNSPSISLSDLTTTVTLHFDVNTKVAEREAESIVESNYYDFFDVSNLQGINFIYSTGKPTMIFDLYHRAVDITFFIFRTSINVVDVNQRFPSKEVTVSNLIHCRHHFRLPNWIHTRNSTYTTLSDSYSSSTV